MIKYRTDGVYVPLVMAALAKRGRHERWTLLLDEIGRKKTDGRHLRPDA